MSIWIGDSWSMVDPDAELLALRKRVEAAERHAEEEATIARSLAKRAEAAERERDERHRDWSRVNLKLIAAERERDEARLQHFTDNEQAERERDVLASLERQAQTKSQFEFDRANLAERERDEAQQKLKNLLIKLSFGEEQA